MERKERQTVSSGGCSNKISHRGRRSGSDLPPPRPVAFSATRWLLADPAEERPQLGRLAKLLDARIENGQRRVGVGGVDHAVTLGTEQLDVFLGATFLARPAVVAGQLARFERPTAQGARPRFWSVIGGSTHRQESP